jgi:hypothetical protein
MVARKALRRIEARANRVLKLCLVRFAAAGVTRRTAARYPGDGP